MLKRLEADPEWDRNERKMAPEAGLPGPALLAPLPETQVFQGHVSFRPRLESGFEAAPCQEWSRGLNRLEDTAMARFMNERFD